VVIGDIAWDVLLRPSGELVWGADVYGSLDLLPGGSSANVAVWAQRLGANVRLVGKVGDDRLGVLMRAHLDEEGVGTHVRGVAGAQTTRIGVLVRPDGEHAFITDHTNPLRLSSDDLPLELLEGADAVFFNGYSVFMAGSAAFAAPLLTEARRRGLLTAFDPSSASLIARYGAARLLQEVGPLDILVANQAEIDVLDRMVGRTALETAVALLVVKQGAEGASAMARGRIHRSQAIPVTVIETTGAGDAFDAAFLLEYLTTRDIDAALAAGNRLGAAVAGVLGAQTRA
jgi:sugar/nucleoside kinase (ribokinase family)